MDAKITEIAERIRALRDATGYTIEEMAEAAGITADEYKDLENAKRDLTFTFLYKCADKFGIDIIELLTGENPHLIGYTIVRSGKGLPMKRREGFEYRHLASNFKNRTAIPLLVNAPFKKEELTKIPMATHDGQEFDYVLKGKLRFAYDGHIEDLGEGDSVYYNSAMSHGMTALSEEGCTFLAIVLKEEHK